MFVKLLVLAIQIAIVSGIVYMFSLINPKLGYLTGGLFALYLL